MLPKLTALPTTNASSTNNQQVLCHTATHMPLLQALLLEKRNQGIRIQADCVDSCGEVLLHRDAYLKVSCLDAVGVRQRVLILVFLIGSTTHLNLHSHLGGGCILEVGGNINVQWRRCENLVQGETGDDG